MNRVLPIPLKLVWVAALAGCAPDRPAVVETEGRPAWDGSWAVDAGRLVSVERGLVLRTAGGSVPLATELVGAPAVSADGRHLAWCHRGEGRSDSVLEAAVLDDEGLVSRHVLDGEGSPDRVALAADGRRVAWVDAADGVAAVFLATFPDGAPRQLTNVDLVRVPGQPPEGFVPPPHDGPLRFDGELLRWDAPAGPQQVVLP